MLKVTYKKTFEKDINRIKNSGKDLEKLKVVAKCLANQEPLDKKYFDHPLKGNYKDRRECHIEPDWLLIYKIDDNRIIFERTGSHSQLFK